MTEPMTHVRRVRAFLEKGDGRYYTASIIASGLDLDGDKVRHALEALRKRKEAERLDTGKRTPLWRLVPGAADRSWSPKGHKVSHTRQPEYRKRHAAKKRAERDKLRAHASSAPATSVEEFLALGGKIERL